MFVKLASVALATLFVITAVSGEAMADHRKRHRVRANLDFYAGPDVVRVPRAMRFMFGGYELDADNYDGIYGADEDAFDESYYDPQVDTASKPAAVKNKAPAAAKAASAPKPTAKPVVKKELTTASIAVPDDDAPEAKSAKKPAAATTLSCDKAQQIVSGYGFTSVAPQACKGTVYQFDATRDGKKFAIKLDASNGELTEVKKLQ